MADPPVCDDGCGIGISFEGGTRNVIDRNVVVRAPIRGIDGDGIAINLDHVGVVADTLVERNVVTGSADDGIDVESPSTTLRGNVVADNDDLGIEAVPDVTDGGQNRAFANGNPRQCTKVQCGRGR